MSSYRHGSPTTFDPIPRERLQTREEKPLQCLSRPLQGSDCYPATTPRNFSQSSQPNKPRGKKRCSRYYPLCIQCSMDSLHMQCSSRLIGHQFQVRFIGQVDCGTTSTCWSSEARAIKVIRVAAARHIDPRHGTWRPHSLQTEAGEYVSPLLFTVRRVVENYHDVFSEVFSEEYTNPQAHSTPRPL